MHPLKTVQWHLFWNKGKSWLQHVDWCTHFSSSTFSLPCILWAFSLALFLWALARQAFSLIWLASVKMSITLTGSFIRMSLDFKLGLFFFFAWTQTWPLSLRKDLALLLPTLGIPNQTACSQCLAFPLLATPGNHLLGQVSFPGTQWLTWFYTCFVLHKRNSTRILHKRNLGKSYAGLWKWSQLSR